MNIRQGFPEQVFLKVLPFLLQDDKTLITNDICRFLTFPELQVQTHPQPSISPCRDPFSPLLKLCQNPPKSFSVNTHGRSEVWSHETAFIIMFLVFTLWTNDLKNFS